MRREIMGYAGEEQDRDDLFRILRKVHRGFHTEPEDKKMARQPHLVSDPTVLSAGIPNSGALFGIALTQESRIRKQTRRLLRALNDIADAEDKLEDLGVDVDDIYDAYGYTSPGDGGTFG
jgi:hypothetical protein